jgi:hypothetical protein
MNDTKVTLAVMHGSSYNGDCGRLLRDLADVYETRFGCHAAAGEGQPLPGHDAPVGAVR